MFAELFTVENLIALFTLIVLEIVLGIDNLVFISIVSDRLEDKLASSARKIGLTLAVLVRILLLAGVSWIVHLKKPLFTIYGVDFSAKSLVLLIGGLYLLVRSTLEIYRKTEGLEEHGPSVKSSSFWGVVGQIVIIDAVFSIESIVTAVGMVGELIIMITAVIVAVGIMIAFVDFISEYISRHASLKLLALSFLMLIGVLLVAEGTGFHFPRGYVYFSMAFALFVQLLNIRYEANMKKKHKKARQSL